MMTQETPAQPQRKPMAAKPADKPVEKPAEAKAPEPPRINPARQRELEAAISSITKTYGEGSIMRLGDAHALRKIDVIPTGALGVDLALGMGVAQAHDASFAVGLGDTRYCGFKLA